MFRLKDCIEDVEINPNSNKVTEGLDLFGTLTKRQEFGFITPDVYHDLHHMYNCMFYRLSAMCHSS